MSNEDLNENEGETAPVDFALTPGRFQSDKIIDYSTESGRKLYKGATEPLKSLHDLSARVFETYEPARTASQDLRLGRYS